MSRGRSGDRMDAADALETPPSPQSPDWREQGFGIVTSWGRNAALGQGTGAYAAVHRAHSGLSMWSVG